MKVLVTAGVFPPEVGGPATYVPSIAAALAARGHELTVVAPMLRDAPCPIADPPYRLVRFAHPDVARYANYAIELGRGLATVLREARAAELIFVNGLELPAAAAARALGRPMVVKVVGDFAWELAHGRGWTRRDLDAFQEERGVRLELLRRLYRSAARHAAAVITPSRYLAGIVERWGVPAARIRTIYNAVDPPAPPPSREDLPPLPDAVRDGFRALTVGRLVAHKRIEQVIDAVAQIPAARLVVAGDGPLRAALEARASLTGRVHFVGAVRKAAVAALLSHYADCLILNSTYEGLPHVLLEAAQLGVPIVATAVGGTVELVREGEGALLIPPDSPADLRRALETLASDPELRARLAAGASGGLDRFRFDRLVEETEQVLLDARR